MFESCLFPIKEQVLGVKTVGSVRTLSLSLDATINKIAAELIFTSQYCTKNKVSHDHSMHCRANTGNMTT